MILGADYTFRDDLKHDTVPIELLEGPYKGVVYRYKTVAVKEQNAETATMNFSYELYEMANKTETALRKDKRFEQYIGLILNQLIIDSMEAPLEVPLKEIDEHRTHDPKGNTQE
jgi:hypothetical protein